MIDWLFGLVLVLMLVLVSLALLGAILVILGWGLYAVIALYKGLKDLG
jgi:hypothetical protein